MHNDHATGCNISLLNINITERIYILLYRENESSAFGCFIWFPSGYYDICYTSLPLYKEYEMCQYLIYINGTEPGKDYYNYHNIIFFSLKKIRLNQLKVILLIVVNYVIHILYRQLVQHYRRCCGKCYSSICSSSSVNMCH